MMATITNADNKSHGGEAPTAAPAPTPTPPGQPNATETCTWPGALRIDVELAENHARRTTGSDGGSKRHCGSGRVAISTRPAPTVKNGVHKVSNRVDFADVDRGGDRDDYDASKEAAEAGARLEVDAEIAESHHACGVWPVRRRRSGITTRSASQQKQQQQKQTILQKDDALVSTGKSCGDEALNSSSDNEVASPSSETPAGGDIGGNNNKNTDGDGGSAAAAVQGQADKLELCHWYEREEKVAEEGGDGGDAAAAAAAFSWETLEPKAGLATLQRGGVEEEEGEHNNKVEDDGVQAQGGPSFPLESRQPPSHANGISGGGANGRHPSSMDRLARFMSRAMATVAKAETTTSAASEGVGLDLRCCGNAAAPAAVTWPTSQPEAPYPDQNDPTATAAAHSGIIGDPPQQQRQGGPETRLTFREAHSDYIHLREKSRYIDARCSASMRTLQSVSEAVGAPGRELRQSYDAYLRAYYFFRAVERSVRSADAQEDAARRELRRASQAARSAQGKQVRAEAALRAFDAAGDGGSSSSSSSCSSSVNGVNEEMLPPPPPSSPPTSSLPPAPPSGDSAPEEGGASTAGGEREEHDENKAETTTMPCTTRASLELALRIARLEARRAFAEKQRAQAVANDALTLVGALTAGDWCLAGEQYDAAKDTFHDVSRDALSKIQEFEDQTLLFRKLMQGRVEIRRQLVLAYKARERAKVAAEMVAAEAMRIRLAAATSVAAEAAMLRAATESGGGGNNSGGGGGGGGPIENGERGGGSALFFVPPDDEEEGWDKGQEIRLWPRKPVPSRPVEDQSGEEGDAGWAARGTTAGNDTDDGNEVPAKKKAKM